MEIISPESGEYVYQEDNKSMMNEMKVTQTVTFESKPIIFKISYTSKHGFVFQITVSAVLLCGKPGS